MYQSGIRLRLIEVFTVVYYLVTSYTVRVHSKQPPPFCVVTIVYILYVKLSTIDLKAPYHLLQECNRTGVLEIYE